MPSAKSKSIFIIHQYFGVDLQQVWLTAIEDLPMFKATVLEMLRGA